MIIGHQKQWNCLKRIAEMGKISHAYLFTGQEKLGKKTVAIEFLSLLFSQNPLGHPDLIILSPINSQIQISQIRDLSWKLSLKPYSAPIKAAIIDQAHLMNSEAQNCFLKTLEEPKGKTVLILITEYPERLFPTILSRCEIIKFYPVPKVEIENYLKQKNCQDFEEISEISEGKPGLALDLFFNPQKMAERKERIKELNQILNSDLSSRFQYAKDLAKKGNLKEILDIWLSYFRKILISIINQNLSRYDLNRIESYPLTKLKNILKQIQTINFLISTTNVNPRLALEMVMLELDYNQEGAPTNYNPPAARQGKT